MQSGAINNLTFDGTTFHRILVFDFLSDNKIIIWKSEICSYFSLKAAKYEMPSCSVIGCRTKHSSYASPFISFHTYPKDSALLAEWVRRTGVVARVGGADDSIKKRHACSVHFAEADFQCVRRGRLSQ